MNLGRVFGLLFPAFLAASPAVHGEVYEPTMADGHRCAQQLVEEILARAAIKEVNVERIQRHASEMGFGEPYYRFEVRRGGELLQGFVYSKLLASVAKADTSEPLGGRLGCTLNTKACGPAFELRNGRGELTLRLGRECGAPFINLGAYFTR